MVKQLDREVYPNAPVVFVALEVRHPDSGSLTPEETNRLKRSLSDKLPILRTAQQVVIAGQIGSSEQQVQQQQFPKLFNRQRTFAASLKNDAIVLETTDYKNFEEFLALAERLMSARAAVREIDGFERVGLRYIDEIRVPGSSPPRWDEWVSQRLIGPELIPQELGYSALETHGLLAMEVAQGRNLVLRFGPRSGFAVDPNGDLRRPSAGAGDFFLCDIDSFWSAQTDTPEFSTESVVEICNDLHSPVRKVFESVVTEKLRSEVFRVGN